MKRKLLRIVFMSVIICVTAYQSLYPEQPVQYILSIDKTGKTTDILQLHKEIKIYQELNSGYLGVTDEKNIATLKALAIPYRVLDKITGSAEIMDRSFLVHLRDICYLDILKQHGTAIQLEGKNVLFLPSGPQHPREMPPNIFRGIKKLGAPVKIGSTPLSPAQISTQGVKAIDPLITAMAAAVSKNNLKNNIQTLQNFITRDATTDECDDAGDFIATALSQSGVQVDEDPFNFEGYSSRNIVGYLPGKTDPSKMVIIGAHYDSYADPNSTKSAPGADDNASGTAAVLEAAQIMSQYSFAHSIKFILFSAEEYGLYGSDHYARQAAGTGEDIIGMINLDMISYTDYLPEDLDVIVNSNSKWLGNLLKTAAQNYSSIEVLTTLDNWADYSDHYSFWDRGFPAVLCIEDYEDSNPYYHTTGDTINTINLDFATEAARVCLAAAAQLAEPGESLVPTITVTSPNGGESWTVGNSYSITWTTTGAVGNVNIKYSTNNGSSWTTIISSTANDGSYTWTVPNAVSSQCKIKISEAADENPSDTSNAVFTIASGLPPTIGLNRTKLYFGGVEAGIHTGAQEVWIHNSGGGTLNWQAGDNAAWLTCSPASGTNNGIITVSIDPSGLAAGTYTGAISITGANASNSPQTVSVTLTIKSGSQDLPPFGDFATPVDSTTVRSSFPVTGWVLDDIGVENVKIYREDGEGASLVYIGDAVFVARARPDVETAYPNYPYNYKSGWGYMLLSYFLPNGGNGVFKLHAIAADASGNNTTLGVKTITIDNNHSVKPFGTIDTPAQGGLVSSSQYINWSWVLTPQPNHIAANGSTINVWVDGVNKGHPTYNIYRSDIASLFPGYANSNGAIGYFSLDTSAYENGLHTIQWSASDSAGNADGIGSRYFLINNTAGDSKQNAVSSANPLLKDMMQIEDIPQSPGPVWLKQGYNDNDFPQVVYSDETDRSTIRVNELERIQIHLDDPMANRSLSGSYGYMVVNNRLESLPVGSTFDSRKGIFYWQPGPGFVGDYHFLFILKQETGQINRKEIIVKIL